MKNLSVITRMKDIISKYPLSTFTFLIAGLIAGAVYSYITPKKYNATSIIEYKSTGAGSDLSLFGPVSSPAVEEITSSSFISNAITDQIDLVNYYVQTDFHKQYNSEAFPYKIDYKILSPAFKQQEYNITQTDENCFVISSSIHGLHRAKSGKFNEEIIDQNLSITITKKARRPYQTTGIIQSPQYSFQIQSPVMLAYDLSEKTNAIQVKETNGTISITCQYENSLKAQTIANALSKHYLNTRTLSSTETSNTNTIDEKLTELSNQLEITENEITAYKQQNNIGDINYETEKTLDIIKSLQLQKSQLEVTLVALNNTSNYLRKNREINNSNVDYGTINDPVFINQIEQLNSKYASKETGQATASTDAEIEAIKVSIAERILNTRKKTVVQITQLKKEIEQTGYLLSTYPEKASALNILNRKLELDKKVYDLLSQRRAESIISGGSILATGRILKPAVTSSIPMFPNLTYCMILGMITGLILSLAVNASINRITSKKIKSRQEIDRQTRLPFLGTITGIQSKSQSLESSISTLCTRILLQPASKMITFASANKGEGKTFVATRLAQAFAAMDKKVLLIDMNTSHPGATSYFNLTPERTLSDVLQGSCDIHDAISLTTFPNLDVLECGKLNAGVNTLLASSRRNEIINSLKLHYDYIISDTPDVGTQIDAIAMMKMSDLNLFILKSNTSQKSLITAQQISKDYQFQNIYLLLNAAKTTSRERTNFKGSSARSTSTQQPDDNYQPSMLRKIALWFY